jgi:putative hemolysin
VVVANHPFGGLDGLLLAQLLLQRRVDVRVLVNRHLARISELQDLFISVDIFGGRKAARENASGLRRALRWVEQGGALAMFPAGEVSHSLTREAGAHIRSGSCRITVVEGA